MNMDEPNTSTGKDSAIEGWSKDEKFYLLQALKAFGSHDINNIQNYVSSKTHIEIREAIEYYKKRAFIHLASEKEKQAQKVKAACKPRVPLASWAKLLTDSFCFEDLQTETSTAVRLIADLEKIPLPASTENIDFKKVYLLIANAMDGKALVADRSSTAVLNKCIIETALSSKAFIKTSAYKYVINSINLDVEKEDGMFPRPTDDHELAALRHLSSQKRYNPLKIPEEYLTHTSDLVLNNPENKQEKKSNVKST